jgi:hypothetical protein
MATCRKVLVRKTVRTTTTIERSVAHPGNTSHFEPEGIGLEDVPEGECQKYEATEIRLELSENEAKVLSNLFDLSDPILNSTTGRPGLKPCRDISEALRAVLYEDKHFATRRPKGAVVGGVEWKSWQSDGHAIAADA